MYRVGELLLFVSLLTWTLNLFTKTHRIRRKPTHENKCEGIASAVVTVTALANLNWIRSCGATQI